MVSRKKKQADARSPDSGSRQCICGSSCHSADAHLPGYLLIGFGIIAVPVNFGLMTGFEWLKAWPLLLVLFGSVLLARTRICKKRAS